jgi:hypothetical protein
MRIYAEEGPRIAAAARAEDQRALMISIDRLLEIHQLMTTSRVRLDTFRDSRLAPRPTATATGDAENVWIPFLVLERVADKLIVG